MYVNKQILKSKLFENIIGQVVLKGIGYIFPILIIPYLYNHIGIENYGHISFAIAFTFYFKVIVEFGFNLSSVQHVVKYKDNSKKLSEIVSSIFFAKLFLSFLLFSIFLVLVLSLNLTKEYIFLYLICYIQVFSVPLSLSWLFRGLENIKLVAKSTLFVQTIILSFVFILVKKKSDFYLVPLIYGINDIIIGLVQIYIAKRDYNIVINECNFKKIIYHLKNSMPFFISNIFLRIFTVSNTLILGVFVGNTAVGIYSIAEKFYAAYLGFVIPLIEEVFYPYFNRVKNIYLANKLILISCLLNILFVGIIFLFSKDIIFMIMKIDNTEIVSIFNILLISCIIVVPMTLLGYCYMSLLNKIKYSIYTTISTSLIHLILLIILGITMNLSTNNIAWLICFTNSFNLILRVLIISKLNKKLNSTHKCN